MAAPMRSARIAAAQLRRPCARCLCAPPLWRSRSRPGLAVLGGANGSASSTRAAPAALRWASASSASPGDLGAAEQASSSAAAPLGLEHPLARLEARGLLKAVTSRAVWEHLDPSSSERRTIYSGVDPSAPSLHLGNLLPLLALWHLRETGVNIVVLVGGATGAIGDPSGRSTERNALEPHELQHNVERITAQIHDLYKRFDEQSAKETSERIALALECEPELSEEDRRPKAPRGELHVCNNAEWYAGVGVLDFLRDTGKYMRLSNMLAKDSVKSRMTPAVEGGEAAGISFTEFSYQLLQAYDFSVLHRRRNCTLQLGGSDQLGNIVAGIELILRLRSSSSGASSAENKAPPLDEQAQPAYGLTLPLLTTASGRKFGKSAGNAVWLDARMTSDFDLYQHLLRAADADVATYLRTLTLLPPRAVEEVLARHAAQPDQRLAQRALADEMVGMLRGAAALRRARTMSALLFERHQEPLPAREVLEAFHDDKRLVRLDGEALGTPLVALAADTGAAASRGDARRLQKNGGLYLNGAALTDVRRALQADDFGGDEPGDTAGRYALLRVGKTEHRVLWLAPDARQR